MTSRRGVPAHRPGGITLRTMSRIELTVDVKADVASTWGVLADVGHHDRWMEDAVSIRFEGSRRSGEGTIFFAATRVGPFRTTDRMVVTEWVDEQRMAVRHEGAVTGTGVFSLEPRDGGGTTVRWSEQLEFPWWFGGPPAQVLARPFLMWVWRRNLSNLARLVDAGPAV
ncbi:MAG TPA: SRPBCC family protein [Candidatus Microthrix parvicella]|nr:SRPBCC family protein [Candidatus Microthrix parvicella]